MKTILDFSRAKREQQPIVMIAAYDALMARLVAETDADAILVGDSVAMVVHGFPSTIHATANATRGWRLLNIDTRVGPIRLTP